MQSVAARACGRLRRFQHCQAPRTHRFAAQLPGERVDPCSQCRAFSLLYPEAGVFSQEVTDMKRLPLFRLSLSLSLCLGALASAQAQTPSNNTLLREALDAPSAERLQAAHERALGSARALLGRGADELNPDELEAALADRVPGFAGWVHRDDGRSVARMARSGTRMGPRSAAELQAALGLAEAPQLRAALWDSRQLLNFKRRAFALASPAGVIATHIDREANRVEVVYEESLSAEAVDRLAAQLEAAGVPKAALVLRPGEMPLRRASVGSSVRAQPLPLAAGAQFNFATSSGNFVCSVGVPAIRNGVRGFVTASHCSQRTYSVGASTRMTAPNGSYVGNETVDPPGFSCPLRDTLGCREADALFASGAAASAYDFGRVLLTNTGSLTVTGTIPVRGTQAYPTVGQTVYKTGRTTGTRSGRVARVCVDALVGDGAGASYGALCSVEINSSSFSAGGDSGSSIWLYDGTGAVITGILSYGSSSSTGFSPWGGVTKELGALTVR